MRLRSVAALGLAVLVLAAACGSGGTTAPSAPAGSGVTPAAPPSPSEGGTGGTPPTADALAGRVFVVTAADGYDIVPGSTITFRFDAGNLGISAGCNQMGAGFEIAADGTLTVGPMMTTEMACEDPLMAQDGAIGAFVDGATLTLDGNTLTLANGGITLTAVDEEVADPDLPLEGTTWTVDGLVANQAVSSVPAGVTATLEFADGTVRVAAGCNSGSGTAEIGEDAITFGPIATTKMACEEDAMAVERHVLGVLAGDVAFRIDARSLTLAGPGGGLTATGS